MPVMLIYAQVGSGRMMSVLSLQSCKSAMFMFKLASFSLNVLCAEESVVLKSMTDMNTIWIRVLYDIPFPMKVRPVLYDIFAILFISFCLSLYRV